MPRMNIRGRAPRIAPALISSRYQARFVNGVHTVFDIDRFGHGPAVGTAKEAGRIADELNQGKRTWAA
jgi:hypothetical protein